MDDILRLGTRGSPLALRQAQEVIEALRRQRPRLRVKVVEVHTRGDRDQQLSLQGTAAEGVFVRELEEALLRGRVDVAVHSLKDLPPGATPGLVLAAITARADPRDAVISRTGLSLAQLPQGARVGTSSPRRAAQLRLLRPDLSLEPIRGNVETRLRKLREGLYDAIVLAQAGLERLGRAAEATEVLEPEVMLPAPGQGALCVQVRTDDAATRALAALADDPHTRAATTAERAFMERLGGGCTVPVAALATVRGSQLHLQGLVVDPEALHPVRGEATGSAAEPETLGVALADELLTRGAADLLEAVP